MGTILKMRKSGFTMVELLVVLVIVAILAAVAAPIYSANTKRAIASDAIAAMSLIRQAEREYSLRNNGAFLPVVDPDDGIYGSALSVDLKVAQYFSNKAFQIEAGTGTNAKPSTFTLASGNTTLVGHPTAPVDFLITANGSDSQACDSTHTTNCAVNAAKAAAICLEMDNTGRIYVNFEANDGVADCSANPTKWEVY